MERHSKECDQVIRIQNIYYMLAYAFQVLNEQGYKNIATESFDNTAELFAAILSQGIRTQIKRGLGKEYIPVTESLSTMRGKIDMSESFKTQAFLKKQIVCSYDEFSVNSYMNRIIKSTVMLLLNSDISKSRKKELRKLMVYFAEVDVIDLYGINWRIQYNKFILEYYRREYPRITSRASQIPWQLDDDRSAMLPVMQTDIMLSCKEKILIIDAKYYAHSTQIQYDSHTLHAGNLYQIFTYVKNKEAELADRPHEVSGMLLYAKTDEDIFPDNEYRMSGNRIEVRTLNLDGDFSFIRAQLDGIAEKYFGIVNQNKDESFIRK